MSKRRSFDKPPGRGWTSPGPKGKYWRKRLADPGEFHSQSFRTIDPGRPGHHKLIIGCPKEFKYTGGRCRDGMKAQSLLYEASRVRRNTEGFMESLEKFINHPWQEDKEIEFIELICQHWPRERNEQRNEHRSFWQSYLRRLRDENRAIHIYASENFLDSLDELINWR